MGHTHTAQDGVQDAAQDSASQREQRRAQRGETQPRDRRPPPGPFEVSIGITDVIGAGGFLRTSAHVLSEMKRSSSSSGKL